jgi:hypothetical protein
MAELVEQKSEYQVGFEKSRDRFMKRDKSLVRRVTAEPMAIVTRIRGAWPRLQAERPQLLRLFDFDAVSFDALIDLAMGLAYADICYQAYVAPPQEFVQAVAEGIELRSVMQTDAESLIKHKILHMNVSDLPDCTKANDNIVSTLMQYTVIFRKNWTDIEGKCALQLSDIVRAQTIASTIQLTLGLRQQGGKDLDAVSEMRDRAFTEVVDTYGEIRAGALYVFRHDPNCDEIAPSLFAGRPSHKKAKDDTEPAETAATPVVPVQAAGAPAAAQTPKAKGNLPIMPGAPGGNPFIE